MAGTWDETFARWAKPPSETEEAKAERAARMVREALRSDAALKDRNFEIVAVGSTRNNTNVRSASDVDLAAVLRSVNYLELPPDGSLTRAMLGVSDASYELPQFRADVARALRGRFGSSEVAPGKLTLTVDETSARLGVDVTPYLVHRRYSGRRVGAGWEFTDGIETRPTDAPGRRIVQWPEQHYQNGKAKNDSTNHRYKRVVRILKRTRDELANAHKSGGATPSCFIEHTVFNAPDSSFNRAEGTYYEDVRAIVAFLWAAARDGRAGPFTEVSRMQTLFRAGEPWSAKTLEDFALAAWQYVGFQS